MAVLEVLCSLLGWFALYQLFCSSCAQRSSEWNCRLVTLSHGVVIVLLTGYVVFVDGPWPFTHAGTENTDLQIFSLEVCLGYFFFDLGWCVFNRSEGPIMMAHHAASIVGLLLALVMGVSGCETCAVVFGSELTNPLLQIRWFLRQLGLYDSLLGDVVDLLFIVLFAIVRVGVGTAMFYCELTSPRTTIIMKLGGVVMYTIAWVFMVDIARFGYKKSRAKYKRWKETQELKEMTKQDVMGE
ncbi:TLC domain-containing protein 5 [Takifugu flavidus]|uniref:Transmembrane protein 136 n=1 Tax=Takifugu flavidus TaxID=433684 RepID=A0A5C6P6S9_9TELE|nr:TLC domain-containing protein 5 [Takifugu flavidus]XP_056909642.1 TLC domain-containing protein 5 [Takifugu flavidus]TWW75203.1 Transmembrane protein 136 [Takifugu flavidus]